MESNYLRIAQLMEQYLSGTISAEDLLELQRFQVLYPKIKTWLDNSEAKQEEIYDLLRIHMRKDIQVKWDSILDEAQSRRKRKKTKKWLVAASTIAVLSVGMWTVTHFSMDKKVSVVTQKSKYVVPGKHQAILTLSNGETVLLGEKDNTTIHEGRNLMKITDNQLDYVDISKDKIYFHKLKVPVGGTYRVQLNDGTIVWLNADSEIEYPSVFIGNQRSVSIKGEAFFEVAKDSSRPFRVKVGESTVEAVGTAFNINTHLREGQIKTILTEGKIKVSVADKSVFVDKGNATLVDNKRITITKADLEEALAWKDGYFYFGGKDLKSIMNEIARWYDLDVEYKQPVSEEKYQGGIKRTESIQAVCAVVEGLTGLDIQMKNRILIVKQKGGQ